ncbi:unnamed protein product [Adineta steineri]|uniref:Uncharacterized protein n=1 Tax=Adineta steineri TaxID=433720 RepID=A0A815M0D4_9BILA|nr:unnamed protein product [Adineta steineri]CAF1416407.1 unnamed protein product [Adineta steineri]
MYLDEVKSMADQNGCIIGITTFWSATPNQNLATWMAKVALREAVSMERVLFHINIPNHLRQSACVDVSCISGFYRVQQMIFPLESLFRIESVSKQNYFWHIELTLVDESDNQFIQTVNSYKVPFGLRSFFTAAGSGKQFFHDLTHEDAAFIQFQLLIDMILRLEHNHIAKSELLEVCRANLSSNPSELEKINAFEQTYQSKDAAKWYTKDCFLYRLLNKSLRNGNIDQIVKLRYFIHDLHNQLAELQFNFLRSRSQNQSILTLYRGLRMTMSEVNEFRHHEGHFLSTNSFLSTTQDYEAALFFSGEGRVSDPEVSVVFDISVDTSIGHSVPFASIEYQSMFQDEDEILFSIGAVFHIGETKEIGERLWTVKLILTPQQEGLWTNLTKHLKKIVNQKAPIYTVERRSSLPSPTPPVQPDDARKALDDLFAHCCIDE